MSFRQFIYHSLWRILTTGTFLFLLLRFFDRRFELKRKSLDETFQRYEALSKATNDAIWDYDLVSGETYYNERIYEIFGYSKEELSDNPNWWESHIHADDRVRVVRKMNRHLTGLSHHWEDEYRFAAAGGQWKTVYDRSYIMRDEKGIPIRMIGAMKDVTDLRQLEKQLHEQQLKDKNLKGQGIIRSYELDRKKVRDALHEDVNQVLAAVKIHMADMKNALPGDQLNANMGHLDSVIQKIRKIANTLSSFTFDVMGLCEAIEEQILVQQQISSVNVRFQDEGFSEERLGKEVALLLYQLTEHLLQQLSEHQEANPICIFLESKGLKSSLKISYSNPDNKFPSPEKDSFIREIRAKLEMYEGTLGISQDSGPVWVIEVTV